VFRLSCPGSWATIGGAADEVFDSETGCPQPEWRESLPAPTAGQFVRRDRIQLPAALRRSASQVCVNDAVQEVEQSNKLATSVQRCVSSHRGLTRNLRATSRLRPVDGVAVTKRLARRFRLSGSPVVSVICRRRATTLQLGRAQRAEGAGLDEEAGARTPASCHVAKRRSIHLRDD
jgi:hypothetical protein